MRSILLYFGSFNPIHKGHIALAEWVVEQGLCDELIFIVSPQNPLKSTSELAPEFSRYEMCEAACKASRYPEQIKVSAVEFVLEKPSYTININSSHKPCSTTHSARAMCPLWIGLNEPKYNATRFINAKFKMQNAKLLCEECVDNCSGVGYGSGEVVVDDLVVKLRSL